jgi:HK97 family phage major capsid protein
MARNNLDGTGWLVEQRDSNLVKSYAETSVIDSEFRPINMTANTVEIPRIEDMDVEFIAKGAAYPEDQSSADTVSFTAVKVGSALRIAEEDVEDDKLADYIGEKKVSAGSSYAKLVDNAGLGVTAAKSGVVVPFTSLYRTLTTADATTGYAANENVLTGTSFDLGDFSALLEINEASNYFDPTGVVAIAHPRFRRVLRDLTDSQGRALLVTDLVNGRQVASIYGVPIRFSNGAMTSALPTKNPNGTGGAKGAAGNPLFAIVQKSAAVVGRRKNFESVYISGRDGTSALTDEDILKVRARVGVGYTVPSAHSLFELTKSA